MGDYRRFAVLLFVGWIFGNIEASTVEEKVCAGTNSRWSVPSDRNIHYNNLKNRFTNCTYVDGNLELTWLHFDFDLSFLQYVREVSGYVLISFVDAQRVVLPSLQVIRGKPLFKVTNYDEEFALIVTSSKMFSLEFPALRDVLSGSIGFFNNHNLCYITTINWKEIISDPNGRYVYSYNASAPERGCPPCHKNCIAGCWGEGKENCQESSKVNCSNDGVCTQHCPPLQIYNLTTKSWEPNPHGKYVYGKSCVKNCPQPLLKHYGACVRECPTNKVAVDGECVPCNGLCQKTCRADPVINSKNIDNFKGCTVIDGNINILEQFFSGYQDFFPNMTSGEIYPAMHPDRLEVFSTVKEITGFLNIQAYHEDFKNLSYFRNLEVIGGRSLFDYSSSLYIIKTSLNSLHLRSLKSINLGTVFISENKHLCFAKEINWSRIRKSSTSQSFISNNKISQDCKSEGLVCDEQCTKDGCWGSGPEQCLFCLHFRLGNTCIQNCNDIPGAYIASNGVCEYCDEQCASCNGLGPMHCNSCKNFRDGSTCVSKCPITKYDEMGICKHCHGNCAGGCTGPSATVGVGGCNFCKKEVMNENVIEYFIPQQHFLSSETGKLCMS